MKKSGHVLVLLIPILFTGGIGFSQVFDKAKLDKYFQAPGENNKFMGSVAISKNGEIIYSRQTGFADIADKVRSDENTNASAPLQKLLQLFWFLKPQKKGK